jgi:hypothetical protein
MGNLQSQSIDGQYKNMSSVFRKIEMIFSSRYIEISQKLRSSDPSGTTSANIETEF